MPYQPVSSGQLTRLVTIQERMESDDGGGGQDVVFSDVGTAWSKVETGGGREFVQAQQLVPELTHRVVMRYRRGLTAKRRLVYGERALAIHAVIDPEERHEQLVLLCSEVSPTA